MSDACLEGEPATGEPARRPGRGPVRRHHLGGGDDHRARRGDGSRAGGAGAGTRPGHRAAPGAAGPDQSATVRVVDQLAAEGYAERRPGRDQRSVAVVLTAKGTQAAARALASREQALSGALAGLTPGERKAF